MVHISREDKTELSRIQNSIISVTWVSNPSSFSSSHCLGKRWTLSYLRDKTLASQMDRNPFLLMPTAIIIHKDSGIKEFGVGLSLFRYMALLFVGTWHFGKRHFGKNILVLLIFWHVYLLFPRTFRHMVILSLWTFQHEDILAPRTFWHGDIMALGCFGTGAKISLCWNSHIAVYGPKISLCQNGTVL